MGLCYSCVDNASVEVIERFGKFHRIAQPGYNCVCCLLGESVAGSLSLRVQQLDVRCETKTRDNVFVNVVVSVQYQVERDNLYSAFYKLTDSSRQITSFVYDCIRATVPKINLDDVFTTKEEIAHDVKEQLTKSMSSFGFMIIQTLVTDIEPDMKVRAAMNEINAAQRMRVAAVEKAEAEKVQVVKAAEADAEAKHLAGQGVTRRPQAIIRGMQDSMKMKAKYLAGQGVARQRQAIINGLRDSIKNFSNDVDDVNSKDVIEMMMITQYFDMLRDVGSRNATIFLPHTPNTVGDISAQIRNGFLQGQAIAPSSHQMDR